MEQVSIWTHVQIHVADCRHVYLRHAATWPRPITTPVERAACINPRDCFDTSINTRVHMSPRYIWPRCHYDTWLSDHVANVIIFCSDMGDRPHSLIHCW
jgi:hypothetical protein